MKGMLAVSFLPVEIIVRETKRFWFAVGLGVGFAGFVVWICGMWAHE